MDARSCPSDATCRPATSVVEQGRQILTVQLQDAPQPYVQVVPKGTKLRAFYVTERGDAFVDLSGDVVSAHPGGSLTELLTVYAVVNADHDEPPCCSAGSDSRRRQGSGHHCRPRRCSTSARARRDARARIAGGAQSETQNSRLKTQRPKLKTVQCSSYEIRRPTRGTTPTHADHPQLFDPRRRLGPRRGRKNESHLHGQRGGSRAALPSQYAAKAGSPPNTACSRAPRPLRSQREASAGKVGGRTQEIQRLIGRSLRTCDEARRDRRAHDHARLRCHSG